MTVDAFNEFLRTRPFEPFVVHLADGRVFYVRHPDGASFSPGGRTVWLFNQHHQIETVDLLLVISLRPFSPGESRTAR